MGKRERPKRTWEDNVEWILEKHDMGVDWIYLAQDRVSSREYGKKKLCFYKMLRISWVAEQLLTSLGPNSIAVIS
jgi:hypothetical protein